MYSLGSQFVCAIIVGKHQVWANIPCNYLSICSSGWKLGKTPGNNIYKLEVMAPNHKNDKVKAQKIWLSDSHWQNFGRRKGRASKERRKSSSIPNHFLSLCIKWLMLQNNQHAVISPSQIQLLPMCVLVTAMNHRDLWKSTNQSVHCQHQRTKSSRSLEAVCQAVHTALWTVFCQDVCHTDSRKKGLKG